jgi:hypothetical protein
MRSSIIHQDLGRTTNAEGELKTIMSTPNRNLWEKLRAIWHRGTKQKKIFYRLIYLNNEIVLTALCYI